MRRSAPDWARYHWARYHWARYARWLAYAFFFAALLRGALLLALGLHAQALRLWLARHQGLGFTDPYCTTGYCDYTMFWLAGDLLRHGQAALLYGPHYAALAAQILPYKTGWWPFVYPPTILLPSWGVSLLPLGPGYYVAGALLTLLAIALLRAAGLPRGVIALGLVSFPAMWNLYLGQFGLLCGALLIYGLARMPQRPWYAGAALGVLAIKPQYALLVPVAVVCTRNWRAMLAGGGVAAAIMAVSWLAGGAATWRAWAGPGQAAMRQILEHSFTPGYQAMGTSAFWMLRSLHLSVPAAYAGQAVISLLCAAAAWRLYPGGRNLPALVILSLLASPYGFADDMAAYSCVLPLLAGRQTPWRNAALAWLWVLPAYLPGLTQHCGFLPTPLLLGAALALSLTQQKQPLLTE